MLKPVIVQNTVKYYINCNTLTIILLDDLAIIYHFLFGDLDGSKISQLAKHQETCKMMFDIRYTA